MIRATLIFVMLLAACSKPSETSPDAGQDASVAEDLGSDMAVPADAGTDAATDVDAAPDKCAAAEPCETFERRMSDCSCLSKFDRKCLDATDCRDTEECREITDNLSICWFEPGPVEVCPGGDTCPDASGDLLAGAVRKSVTPVGFETPTPAGLDGEVVKRDPYRLYSDADWNDCGLDGLCPGDDGYTAPDEGEGDGRPQGMWMAGFTTGRAAQYCPEELIGCDRPECCVSKFAHDDIEVNIVVFRQGETTVAFAAIDTVGFFHTDIVRIHDAVRDAAGVDLLVMAATHNHEAPDTAGQWGPGRPAPTSTGRLPTYLKLIQDQTVAGIEEAIAGLQPAQVEAAVVDAGTDGLAIGDSRAPYIFDDNIPVVRVTNATSGGPIATMFSIANHAEVLWSQNVLLTSDYFHFARKYVLEGLPEVVDLGTGTTLRALDGHGGVAVAFAGAVGGLINPGRGGAKDRAGNVFEGENEHTWGAADAVGQQVAARVLGADLQAVQGSLSYATKQFLVPVENRQLELAALALNLIERDVYNASRVAGRLEPDGHSYALSQVAVVRLGELEFFTAPGEMFPETLVGGFPGKPRIQNPVVGNTRSAPICDDQGMPVPNEDGTNYCIVNADQENPPDWTMTPDGPYGYERFEGEFPFFIGLGMDFLGYMVPPYDYEEVGFFTQAPGSHYEETNGISSTIVNDWETNVQICIDALP